MGIIHGAKNPINGNQKDTAAHFLRARSHLSRCASPVGATVACKVPLNFRVKGGEDFRYSMFQGWTWTDPRS